MRVVVNDRQKSDQEQDHQVAGQLEDLDVRSTDDVPVVNDLDEQAGEDAEMRPGRTRLQTTSHAASSRSNTFRTAVRHRAPYPSLVRAVAKKRQIGNPTHMW